MTYLGTYSGSGHSRHLGQRGRGPGALAGMFAGFLVTALLIAGPALSESTTDTEVQLTKGNIVLSNADGTQITMAPGSDVSVGKDGDGVALITLNGGEVYLSNVLGQAGAPLRLRMGDEVVEINRASVMVSRTGDAMDVTLLHGRGVTFRSSGAPSLTQAGTRLQLGRGAPQVNRPSARQMAAIKGKVGILAPGARQQATQRLRGGRGTSLRPPASPQGALQAQIFQRAQRAVQIRGLLPPGDRPPVPVFPNVPVGDPLPNVPPPPGGVIIPVFPNIPVGRPLP